MSDPTPQLRTAPVLLGVLDELRAREPLFHREEFGTTRAALAALVVDDFWEVGASGRRYTRAFVLDVAEERWAKRLPDPWETSDFHCLEVGPETFALTYTLRQDARFTRRLTLWRRIGGTWKALYHQGTLVSG